MWYASISSAFAVFCLKEGGRRDSCRHPEFCGVVLGLVCLALFSALTLHAFFFINEAGIEIL